MRDEKQMMRRQGQRDFDAVLGEAGRTVEWRQLVPVGVKPHARRVRRDKAQVIISHEDGHRHPEQHRCLYLNTHRNQLLMCIFDHIRRFKRRDGRRIVFLLKSDHFVVYLLLLPFPVLTHRNCASVHRRCEETEAGTVQDRQGISSPNPSENLREVVFQTSQGRLKRKVSVAVRHLDGVLVGRRE